jgi:hypothetical protein
MKTQAPTVILTSFAIGIGNGMHPDIPHLPHTPINLFNMAPQITTTASASATTGMISFWSPPL